LLCAQKNRLLKGDLFCAQGGKSRPLHGQYHEYFSAENFSIPTHLPSLVPSLKSFNHSLFNPIGFFGIQKFQKMLNRGSNSTRKQSPLLTPTHKIKARFRVFYFVRRVGYASHFPSTKFSPSLKFIWAPARTQVC
jgi:hypothetical protein